MEIARGQAGIVTREQALAAGLSLGTIRNRLESGRWRRVFRGVYATFTGPLPRPALLWAAVLRAGPGAILSHDSAAEVVGLAPREPGPIHVTVATDRTPDPIPGVVIHRSGRADAARHPSRRPPQTRIEETIIDLTQTVGSRDDAVGWLARAVGARLTTPARLVEALERRKKVRWRPLLLAGLRDVATGCHSLLEVWYLRDVERAHGLPRADRQAPGSGRRYRDVLYRRYGTVVELDGRAAHPEDLRFRDLRRDNTAVAEGGRVLRYGAADVTGAPCAVAAQVVAVLRREGWRAKPRRCSRPECVIP